MHDVSFLTCSEINEITIIIMSYYVYYALQDDYAQILSWILWRKLQFKWDQRRRKKEVDRARFAAREMGPAIGSWKTYRATCYMRNAARYNRSYDSISLTVQVGHWHAVSWMYMDVHGLRSLRPTNAFVAVMSSKLAQTMKPNMVDMVEPAAMYRRDLNQNAARAGTQRQPEDSTAQSHRVLLHSSP